MKLPGVFNFTYPPKYEGKLATPCGDTRLTHFTCCT